MRRANRNTYMIFSQAKIATFSLVLTASIMLAASPVMAQTNIANLPIPRVGPPTVGGLMGLVKGVVQWVYILFFVLAVLFILIAAFRYLTAAGDPEKVKSAQNMLIYAVVAIVIAFLAVGFETIIGTFLTNPSA